MSVIWELFRGGAYRPLEPIKPRTIVDLGANIGVFAAYCVKAFGDGLERYVGVEPDAASFEILKENVDRLGLTDRSHLVRVAVADREGVDMFDTSGTSWSHCLSPDGSDVVDVRRLSTVLDDAGVERVDLLKIDIEGAESELLRDVDAWAERVDLLVAELHGDFDFEAFRHALEPVGFDVSDAGALFAGNPGALRRGLFGRE